VHVPPTKAIGMEPPATVVGGLVLPGGAGAGASAEQATETAAGCKGLREPVPLRLRLGRASRRAGPGTPAPSWKMDDEEEAASLATAAAKRSLASASARQLGGSLWEVHDAAPEAQLRWQGGTGLASAGREGAGESDQVRVTGSVFLLTVHGFVLVL
jgi:hypothetical protein